MAAPGFVDTAPTYQWTEYGIPIRNLWYMLMYAWDEPPLERLGLLENIEDAPTLDALLASILLKLIQQRMRIGLGRNYCEEQHLLRGIRGCINFTDSLKHHAFEHGQAYCNFEQYSLNVPKNQIVRSTLMRLIPMGRFGPDTNRANELRQQLRWVTRAMDGIDLVELKLDFIRRQQLGRNDSDYKLMLAICELILERQMPTHVTGDTRLPSLDQASMVMHRIYERFIACFYRTHLKDWEVTPQKNIKWHEKTMNNYLPSMRPDLVLEEKKTGRIIVLDTKFTPKNLITNQWGSKTFDSSHLYQLYAYLKTQEHLSKQTRCASGILLYPIVDKLRLSEKILLQDLKIQIETVDLTAPWQDIECCLLELIAE
jgi:5-methylcytosine-specific restriction enzyme subunit McrC